METKRKLAFKEKIKTGLEIAAGTLIMGTLLAGTAALYTETRYARTETERVSGCTITAYHPSTEWECSSVEALTPSGTLIKAYIPFFTGGLESSIQKALLTEHKAIPATLEKVTKVYRSRWGKGPEKYSSIIQVKSLEDKRYP